MEVAVDSWGRQSEQAGNLKVPCRESEKKLTFEDASKNLYTLTYIH